MVENDYRAFVTDAVHQRVLMQAVFSDSLNKFSYVENKPVLSFADMTEKSLAATLCLEACETHNQSVEWQNQISICGYTAYCDNAHTAKQIETMPRAMKTAAMNSHAQLVDSFERVPQDEHPIRVNVFHNCQSYSMTRLRE